MLLILLQKYLGDAIAYVRAKKGKQFASSTNVEAASAMG
jgi:hypothetical protein